jgi:hypothetical protein
MRLTIGRDRGAGALAMRKRRAVAAAVISQQEAAQPRAPGRAPLWWTTKIVPKIEPTEKPAEDVGGGGPRVMARLPDMLAPPRAAMTREPDRAVVHEEHRPEAGKRARRRAVAV